MSEDYQGDCLSGKAVLVHWALVLFAVFLKVAPTKLTPKVHLDSKTTSLHRKIPELAMNQLDMSHLIHGIGIMIPSQSTPLLQSIGSKMGRKLPFSFSEAWVELRPFNFIQLKAEFSSVIWSGNASTYDHTGQRKAKKMSSPARCRASRATFSGLGGFRQLLN